MKKRGPGRPRKYPNPNEMPAAGNIQHNVSLNASENQAYDFVLVKASIWYCSTHYKPVVSPEWCNKLEKVFMALDMLMNVEEAQTNPPPQAVWLSSVSAWPSEKIPF